jgi:hypothetical protein
MKLSAYRQDTETDRMDRLGRVQRRLERGRKDDPLPIDALHDRKGTLYVNWRETPLSSEIVTVARAWKKEGEWSTNHYVLGTPLLEDVLGGGPW